MEILSPRKLNSLLNRFRYIDFLGQQLWSHMHFVIGASSLSRALDKYPASRERFGRSVILRTSPDFRRALPIRIKSVPYVSGVHPEAQPGKSVFDINIPPGSPVILWHDVINNSVTSHPKHPRTPLRTAHLLKKLERVPNLVAIVYIQSKTPTSQLPSSSKTHSNCESQYFT